jgi:hypothetical protein
MNSRQKKVLFIGGGLVALMLLFPPWDYFDSDTSARRPAGYHFFLTPPEPKSAKEIFGPPRFPHMTRVRINTIRFILQLSITIPAWLGLAFLLESHRTVISLAVGIVFLIASALVGGFIVWLVVSEGLEYGNWSFP